MGMVAGVIGTAVVDAPLDTEAADGVEPCFTRYGEEAPSAPLTQEPDMTTSRTCALVSLAATIILTGALGACAGAPRQAPGRWGAAEASPHAIRFDNAARDYVRVYLVGEWREWMLGRVEPGAVAMLQIPGAALAEQPGLLRLAVIAGGPTTLRAARDPRSQFTVAQPGSAILAQEWRFAQGQITSLGARRSRGAVGLP